MKKYLIVASTITIGIFLFLAVDGCKRADRPGTSESIKSAEKTSFDEVASQLDTGGNLYLYLSTEQLVDGLSKKVGTWRQLADSIPDQEDAEKIGKALDLVTNLIRTSGIEEVSGFGVSAIAVEPGLYRTKAFLHHYSGKDSGLLWKVGGAKPHSMAGLGMLPANTAFATFADADFGLVWSEIQSQINQSQFPEAREFLAKLPEQFQKATGLDWEKVIHSLGGEYGLMITLDDSRMIPVPLPTSQPLQIPEPAIAIVIKVRDETIFNRIEKELKTNPNVVSVDKPDVKMRTLPVPLPLPIQLRPTVAASGGYLVIASTDALVQEILAVKAGSKPGLKSTEEFKHLSQGIPDQGNQFTFLSKRFGETLFQIQKQAIEMASRDKSGRGQLLQSLLGSDHAAFSYSVCANTGQGWLTVGNGNQHPAKMFSVAAALPIGILAGIAVPNFIKARATSQKNACINNLRQLQAAKAQWAADKDKSGNATPSQEDLEAYLHRGFPSCPAGGDYTTGPLNEPPTCSIPEHRLPKM